MNTQTAVLEQLSTLIEPVDVVVLSTKPDIMPAIGNMLASHGLTSMNLSFRDFPVIKDNPSLVGTVLIDASGLDLKQQKSLRDIIKVLEAADVASILINSWVDLSKEFTLLGTLYSSTIEELWGRIQSNLAFARKRKAILRTASTENHGSLASDSVTEELKVAGRVQRDFLPAQLPASERIRWASIFRPADWVSGDIYDIARLDETHTGFYIADAVGHSLPAALLTMFLKQAIVMRETTGNTYKVFEPAEVMDKLNKRMVAQKLSGCQFATCCYGLLDIQKMELKFSRGGHPYPLIIHADGSMEQMQMRGPLLGIFENAEFFQDSVKLSSGDKVLLYSDGAEPLFGRFDSNKGFQYAADLLSVKDQPIESMLKILERRIEGRKFTAAEFDDITIIGLEIA